MDLKAKKNFSNGHTGNVVQGQVLYDLPQHIAVHFVENGLCEFLGKGKDVRPLDGAPGQPSLSSQAGQASQSNSANTSDSDTSKAPAEPSQSTPRISASRGQTQSMDSTALGGKNTTKKRPGRPKK